MSEYKDPGRSREQARRAADQAEKARIAEIGIDLMNRWNRDLRDPSLMAVLGHDTVFGYEFSIQRAGATFVVEVRRDMTDD